MIVAIPIPEIAKPRIAIKGVEVKAASPIPKLERIQPMVMIFLFPILGTTLSPDKRPIAIVVENAANPSPVIAAELFKVSFK